MRHPRQAKLPDRSRHWLVAGLLASVIWHGAILWAVAAVISHGTGTATHGNTGNTIALSIVKKPNHTPMLVRTTINVTQPHRATPTPAPIFTPATSPKTTPVRRPTQTNRPFALTTRATTLARTRVAQELPSVGNHSLAKAEPALAPATTTSTPETASSDLTANTVLGNGDASTPGNYTATSPALIEPAPMPTPTPVPATPMPTPTPHPAPLPLRREAEPTPASPPPAPRIPAKLRPRGNPAPAYPDEARRKKQTGVVRLTLSVGADGRVFDAQVEQSSGVAALDAAALQAARRWEFEPAREGNTPVASRVVVPFRFRLEQ